MENVTVDARKKPCPQPVILTKKALEQIKEGEVITLVDNEVARDNVEKFARNLGLKCSINKKSDYFELSILKEKGTQGTNSDVALEGITCNSVEDDYVVLVSRDTFGEGLEELGKVLLKNYLYTLTEIENLPKAILFVNGGVKLTTQGSLSIETIKELEDMGIEILSCGTCLDYYKLKDKLKVGKVTNMYEIVERTTEMRTITL